MLQPTSIFSRSPYSESGEWFFCLRHPVEDGSVHVVMVGELDLATAARAGRVLRRAQDDAARVVCDLDDLSFLDVCGLHVLLGASAYARRTGGRLVLAHAPPYLERILAMAEVGRGLEIDRGAPCSPSRRPADRAPGSRGGRLRLVGARPRR